MKTCLYLLLRMLTAGAASLFLAAVMSLRAEDAAETKDAEQMEALANAQGSTKVIDNLSGRFATFAGSQANAAALITGLHSGSAIDLTTTANGQTSMTTFAPVTGKMGFGNVFISLSIAQDQLTKLGITQPTPAQIQAALDGGSVTTGSGASATTTQLNGVLVLRNEGMGWGQVAQSVGVKLGTVMSDLHAADRHINDKVPQTVHAGASERVESPAAAAASARPDSVGAGRPDIPARVEHIDRPEIPARPATPGHH